MVNRSRKRTKNDKVGFLGKVGLVVMGGMAGAGLYHIIDNHVFDSGVINSGVVQEQVVNTADSETVYSMFKSGAEVNYAGLQEAMATDYNGNREEAQAVVGLCKDIVGMEKDYIKGIFASMPVLSGSANPDSLSLEMKLIAGHKVAMVTDDLSGAQYMVTQTEILDMAKLGLYPMPNESLPAQSVDTNAAKSVAEKNSGQQYNNPLLSLAKSIGDVIPDAMDKIAQYQ